MRAIVGESPLIVEHEENVQLEASIIKAKASLKEQRESFSAVDLSWGAF